MKAAIAGSLTDYIEQLIAAKIVELSIPPSHTRQLADARFNVEQAKSALKFELECSTPEDGA